MHYGAWGDPSGPALVLLHGLRGSAETSWRVADALGRRVIALDERGRGASDWAPDGDYSHEACLLDFEEFVDALQLDRFALLGHSAGGAVALAYALRHPDRVEKLVLEDIGVPAAGRAHGVSLRAELVQLPLTFASWEDASAYQRRRNPKFSEQRLKASLPYFFRQMADGTTTTVARLVRTAASILRSVPAPWHDARTLHTLDSTAPDW